MDNILGYIAYVFILATGIIQATSMILGRNFRYSIWSALSIEFGLVLLQLSLFLTGGAPMYVIIGNAVSVVANGVCLAYMLRPSHGLADHDPELEGLNIRDNTFSGPSSNSITLPAPEHNHPSYGLRAGEPYWEHTDDCPACGRILFDETQMREV